MSWTRQGEGDEKMHIPRKITAITTAAAMAATAMGPLATAASADGWRDGRRGGSEYTVAHYEKRHYKRDRRHNKRDRRHKRRHADRYYDGDRYYGKRHRRHAKRDYYEDRHYWKKHRRYKKKRDKTGKYIAIGMGALMLGILLSQTSRR